MAFNAAIFPILVIAKSNQSYFFVGQSNNCLAGAKTGLVELNFIIMLEKFKKNGLKNLAFYSGGEVKQTVRGPNNSQCDSFETDGSKKNAEDIWYGDEVKRFNCPTE